jgi:hypothetical protein
VFRAFFALLLASIQGQLVLKIGASGDRLDDMRLEGKVAVGGRLLRNMYCELGGRRDGNGRLLTVEQILDCAEV